MAVFQPRTSSTHDDYMTPKYAWENIKHIIPKDKLIWEAFYGNGQSGTYLKELGFNTIHEPLDFFENNFGDIIVTNPPFSKVKQIMVRLYELDKPFILIMPSSKINTSYFRPWRDKGLQIIIPPKRIQFEKYIDGKIVEKQNKSCTFDCFYYCYKIGLEKDIVWLE